MKILFIGDLNPHSRSFQRYRAMKELGYDVVGLPIVPIVADDTAKKKILPKLTYSFFFKCGCPLDRTNVNRRIIQKVNEKTFHVIWIEKGNQIRPNTLKYVKNKSVRLICYTNDNMLKPHNRSRYFMKNIRYFDQIITIFGYDTNFFRKFGGKNILTVDRLHDKSLLCTNDEFRKTHDVLFVGTYEKNRYEMMKFLAGEGITVTIYGNGWPRQSGDNLRIMGSPIYGSEFSNIIRRSKVVLNFLRKINDDVTTGRSFEIPACGSLMLAERTDEHKRLLEEDREAVFFDINDKDELLNKVRYYLDHEKEREDIAKAGRQRCINSGYSHHDLLKQIFWELRNENNGIS